MNRQFDMLRDRVARKPGMYNVGSTSAATRDIGEAIEYARYRATRTGKRQFVRRSPKYGWFHVLVMEDKA